METKKIAAYILLAVGILLIIVPLFQTYRIFTGGATPPEVFKKPVALQPDKQASPFDVQKQVQNAVINVIPIDFINNTLNFISWLLLMWILMYGGGKLADIGVKLLR